MFTRLNALFQGLVPYLCDVALLAVRILLAYGFYEPAKGKWADIDATAAWFAELGIPGPTLNAWMAASTEMAGVFLLALGLGTRFISVPLMGTMVVAITFVHAENGFPASDNGYEIPLYYGVFLLTLLAFGGGRFSADHLIARWWKSRQS